MPNLAQIVEHAHLAQKHGPEPSNGDTTSPANGSATPTTSGNQNHLTATDEKQPARPGHVSAPSSPRTRHSNMPRSSSLASPVHQYPEEIPSVTRRPGRTQTGALDPLSSSFVRTDSQFRNVWSYQDPDAAVDSRRSSKQRRGSSGDENGIWRRWVEIPLGLAPDPDEGGDVGGGLAGTKTRSGQATPLGPRTSSPEPAEDEEQLLNNQAPAVEENAGPSGSGVSPSRQASTSGGVWPITEGLKLLGLSRTKSMPHMSRKGSRSEEHPTEADKAAAQKGWTVIKNRLRSPSHSGGIHPFGGKGKQHSTVMAPSTAAEIDLNEELMAGPLASLILRMHFERDENDRRRVPVLLQHLKIRVSDSVHPMHGTHAVFRIECEYGDGAARWVIYRELRDFLSLHTHYSLSLSTYRSKGLDIPEFPRTSIPLFKILKKEGRDKGSEPGKAEFARQQRETLENYLIGLIKAVMFHPEANRLCRWFEISALSVALSARGGIQGKAGLLRVLSSNSSRKGPHAINFNGWKQKHTSKWWLVRESYLVSVLDPASIQIDDVFMLDADFAIDRPKRVYRQGLNLLHIGNTEHEAGGSKGGNDWDITKRPSLAPGAAEKQEAAAKEAADKEHADGDHPEQGREGGNNPEQEHDREQATETATVKSKSSISRFFSLSRHKREDDQEKPKKDDHAFGNSMHVDKLHSKEKEKNPDPDEDETRRRSDEQRPLGITGNVMEADIKPLDPKLVPQNRTANVEGTNVDGIPDNNPRQRDNVRRHLKDEDASSSDEASSDDDDHPNTVIDPSIGRDPRKVGTGDSGEPGANNEKKKKTSKDVSQHTFYLRNTQRKVKFVAKNERQMLQFIASMERMAAQSHWTGSNRFGSFAPIRLNVSAQWLVDGRDYFWNLSRAIMLAKERIYIHDWWLSPEIYLRRPGQEAYRLDRLLKRKAEQGVKIYVILYKEVSNRTTPVDSNYAKRQLMGLHPNILVQRSPSHFTTGTFYWAHHEKMCVIDETIAFMGGVDLCFGRWDTPQHVLVDDGDGEGTEGSEKIWKGKDYSNARVIDFHSLNKPDEDMYDRTKVARMPWHDIGLQIIGQPARDLCRHFVQRWNYLLRTKTHSRVMPFLLPAPDFKVSELTEQGLTGTCEIQICRSAGPWSLGTSTRIEHSIQNAYLKAIELSEHFVYIENQFFITSTVVNEVQVENNIGDALVHRIVRAHREGTAWRAVIVIPLLPGFTFPIDHNDASAIRLIVELQNRSICRGPHSIFSRLRKEGINPDDYITFFSLRGWGKLGDKSLTTEQVYIHAKIMIVDDRVSIIGSANINERSMRGDRDSELACVIRDTDMIDSTMAGKPFQVGRFSHTMRIRLMREHVGVDTDAMYEEDLMANQATTKLEDVKTWDPDHEQVGGKTEGITNVKHRTAAERYTKTAHDLVQQGLYGAAEIAAKIGKSSNKHGHLPVDLVGAPGKKAQEDEKRTQGSDGSSQAGFASSKVPTLEEKVVAEHLPKKRQAGEDKPLMDAIDEGDVKGSDDVEQAGVEDGTELYGAPADAALSAATDDRPPNDRPGQEEASEVERSAPEARKQIRKHLAVKTGAKPYTLPTPKAEIDPHGFTDPLDTRCFNDMWLATAVHNTEIYRKVFHCTPDDLVTTWKQYKEFLQFQDRLNRPAKDAPASAPHIARLPSEGGTAGEDAGGPPNTHPDGEMDPKTGILSDKGAGPRSKSPSSDEGQPHAAPTSGGTQRRSGEQGAGDSRPRRPTNVDEPLEQWERDEFEALLEEVQGHLVVFPTRFLEGEDTANNFLFNSDRLLPMPIFN